jgi:hypothetical protein
VASAGFNSPSILFLNTWDAPERTYIQTLARRLHAQGRYDRVVEPFCGAFIQPSAYVGAGYRPDQIETSDVSLYSAILGTYLSGGSPASLNVRLDNKLVKLPDDPQRAAATLLYTQALARMENRPDVAYFQEICRDLVTRHELHVKHLAAMLGRLNDRFGGLAFRSMDAIEHMRTVADSPTTFVAANPPTYTGGFEKFFDTDGRLTWDETPYDIWEPTTGQPALVRESADWQSLMLIQEQAEPNEGQPGTVYARHLSEGQVVYLWSNRPHEITALMGPMAHTRIERPSISPTYTPIAYTETLPEQPQRIDLAAVTNDEAMYWRDLWTHRIGFKNAGQNVVVTVDGVFVGLFGYDVSSVVRPYHGGNTQVQNGIVLTYALGAPNEAHRLTRLVTMLALAQDSVNVTVPNWWATVAERLITVEYTRHAEAKGLRGIMKLVRRDHDSERGNKLIYAGELLDKTWMVIYADWKRKEAHWRKSRTSAMA